MTRSLERATGNGRPASAQGWAGQAPRPIRNLEAGAGGRVVVADDDVLLREGLAALLSGSGFDVVGQCSEPAQLLTLVQQQRPDLVILDVRMPPTYTTEGLDAAQVLREELPETGVLVLSAYVLVERAIELLASGQRTGYLLKNRICDVDNFLATLDQIVRGGAVVDPAVAQQLLATRRVDAPLKVLSEREREVLALMAEGRSNAGIARQLYVAECTVEKHVHFILRKLRIPEAADDHRRVLAVLTFLDRQ